MNEKNKTVPINEKVKRVDRSVQTSITVWGWTQPLTRYHLKCLGIYAAHIGTRYLTRTLLTHQKCRDTGKNFVKIF